MLLEERRLHMGAWCEETLAVHRSGEPVATKLHRIAENVQITCEYYVRSRVRK